MPQISISDASATEGATAIRFFDEFVPRNSGGLTDPREVVLGPDGYLYVANGLPNPSPGDPSSFVARYDAQTGEFVDVAFKSGDAGVNCDLPWAMTFGPDDKLYVTGGLSHNVVRYDPATNTLEEFIGPSDGVYGPHGIAFGPDQALYVSNGQLTDVQTSPLENQVLRFQVPADGSPGNFIDVFVPPGNGLVKANALAFHGDSLFISSALSQSILRYDASSGAFQGAFVQPGNGLDRPSFLKFHTDGYLYVSNHRGDQLLRYNGTTGAFVDAIVPTGSGGLDEPAGFVFDSDGNIYLGSRLTGEVLRYGPTSQADFTVSLSAASNNYVSVDYATADLTASSAVGSADYVPTTGTITFAPGQTSRTILISTNDDVDLEGDETFYVNLSNAVGGVIVDAQAVGTIVDNELPPHSRQSGRQRE